MSTSWWLADELPSVPRRRVEAPDVEIVGGGYTGCSCALTLATAGLRVRVYDAREIAGGASGRNGGFALRGGAMPYDGAREWLGEEHAREYWQLTEEYLDRLAEVGACDLRRVGCRNAIVMPRRARTRG